jgi:Photosystem II reaction centre X protein (PsbX)
VTPSLRNLLYSVIAGGTVLFVLFGAVSLVAQFDPVSRK